VAHLPVMCSSPGSAWESRAEDNYVYVYKCIVRAIYLYRST
jgi:hypothetical protein